MDEQRFNMSMRKFLKEVGVTSQQEIERVVREEGLGGKGALKVKMVLTGGRHRAQAMSSKARSIWDRAKWWRTIPGRRSSRSTRTEGF